MNQEFNHYLNFTVVTKKIVQNVSMITEKYRSIIALLPQYFRGDYPYGLILQELPKNLYTILLVTYILYGALLTFVILQLCALNLYGVKAARRINKEVKLSLPRYPYLSIILPVKNEPIEVIEDMIKRLSTVIYPRDRFEIIIVSDDPKDYFEKIKCRVESISEKLGLNVKLLNREPIGYRGLAYNYAVNYAKGEILAFIDIDTKLPPNYFIEAINLLNNGYDIVSSSWRGYVTLPTSVARSLKVVYDIFNELFLRGRFLCKGFTIAGGSNVVMKRRVFEQLNGWCNCSADDLDLSIRARLRGFKIGLITNIYVNVEVPPNYTILKSQSARWLANGVWALRNYMKSIVKSRNLSLWEKIDAFLWLTQYPSLSAIPLSIVISILTYLLNVIIPPIPILTLQIIFTLLSFGIFFNSIIIGKKCGYSIIDIAGSLGRCAILSIALSYSALICTLKALFKEWSWIPTPKGVKVLSSKTGNLVLEFTVTLLLTALAVSFIILENYILSMYLLMNVVFMLYALMNSRIR